MLLDWLVFSLFLHLGWDVILANLCGRVSGATLGFWLNGRFTFARGGEARLGRRRLARFATLWLTLTLLSTVSLHALSLLLPRDALYWAKPIVEAGCAALGFLGARWWVYR